MDTFTDTHLCLALGVQEVTTNVPARVRAWIHDAGAVTRQSV